MRHEVKHWMNRADHMALSAKLEAIARRDSHSGAAGRYQVRSLYFETPDDKALREKLYGVDRREKFRIRMYDGNETYIRLEKKRKEGNLGEKLASPLTKEEIQSILFGDLEWMKRSERGLVLELYAKMKGQRLAPKTIVEYTREAFVYAPGNVRITLDSDLRTGLRSTDFFDPELPMIRVSAGDEIVLEVKFDAFLPEVIQETLQIGSRRQTAFSKYAVCRIFD